MVKQDRVCGLPKRLLVTLGMISIQVTNVAYNVVAKLAVGGGGGGADHHGNHTNTSGKSPAKNVVSFLFPSPLSCSSPLLLSPPLSSFPLAYVRISFRC